MEQITDYNTVNKLITDFKKIVEKQDSIICKCYRLYELESYENDEGSQGTHYVYIAEAETEAELIKLCKNYSDCRVILPVNKTGSGKIISGGKVIDNIFYNYNGICKVLISYKKQRDWITCYSLKAGYECMPALAYTNEKKPEKLINYKVSKDEIDIIWGKESIEESDEE